MFSNIHHLAIIGNNYQKTREFYVEKLGFKVIRSIIEKIKMILS